MINGNQVSNQSEPAQPINWKALLAGLAFAGMFFGLGFAFLYYGVFVPKRAVRESQDWVETPCEILSSRLDVHDGDNFESRKGKTYSIEVEYTYRFQEQEYTGDRYDFSETSDGYLEPKQEILQSLKPGTKTVCFVNPRSPAEAVIRRGYGPETADWKGAVFLWVSSVGLMLLGLLVGGGTLLFCCLDRFNNAFDRHLDRIVERMDPEGAAENYVEQKSVPQLPSVATDVETAGVIPAHRARELLGEHGETRSQDDSNWEGTVPLPDEIARFYREVGPVNIQIPSVGSEPYLPSLSELWSLQKEYRGSLADESLWNRTFGKWFGQWQRDWIAVAREGTDSVFVFSTTGKNILHVFGMDGPGEWRQVEIYPDLNTMAGCLAILGSVYAEAGGDNFEDFMDDRGLIHPPSMTAAKSRLTAEIGSETQAEEILGASGWA